MAENVLNTIIQLRYGTYSQWMNSRLILKQGEAAICAFPNDRVIEQLSNSRPDYTPPSVGIKIGDGEHYFYELPWVQSVAADVYTWAKSSVKPTYTAQEIQGLQAYIENLINGDVEVNIAPRIYQIVEGTGDNEGKYYLRYKENNDEAEWVVDTSSYIDISNVSKIVEWIGITNLNDYPNMITRNAAQIRAFLGTLNTADTAITNQFVTAVTETNGIISVERTRPSFSNLNGYATVEQGGTGRTTLEENNVLVGNGSNQVILRPIAEAITNNNHLVPSNIIKAYVDNAVEGLSGAMHFIGDASVIINNGSSVDPRINGYNFAAASPGDVILYDTKEFVWTGTNWRLLGDEGSYVVKGSIKDADIDAEANIQQSKIANLSNTFATKVDKIDGKTLTSNDFTDEYKNKLDNIETGAQRNIIEHIIVNGEEKISTTIEQVPNTVNIEINEFDDTSRTKLAGIAAGAEVNKIEKITYDGVEVTPDANRVVAITSNPHTDHINKIEQIFINGVEWVPNQNKQVRITIDQAALNLNVLEGATIPNGQGGTQDVNQVQKKLELERIAVTGDVKDLHQTNDTYIVFNCGSSTEVI